MNSYGLGWEILLALVSLFIGVRALIQFKKLGRSISLFIILSFITLSSYFIFSSIVPHQEIRIGSISLWGGLLGAASFSFLSLVILSFMPESKDKMGTFLRFPFAGLLLGMYLGESYSWGIFALVQLFILILLYLNKKKYPLPFTGGILSFIFISLSVFFRGEHLYLSYFSFLLYLFIFSRVITIGLIGLLFKQEAN